MIMQGQLQHMTSTQELLQQLESKAESASKEFAHLLQELKRATKDSVQSTYEHVKLHGDIIQQLKVDSENVIQTGDDLLQQSSSILQKLSKVEDFRNDVSQLKAEVDDLLQGLVKAGYVVIKEDAPR
eukprot:TRINITY_DN4616_c0_g1_i1.p5 TRINITY_DN4616_c0_g1~~TRINITY_DN4616_c0_g1_i1.p5  ORF type:complete len:127 (+),score=13.22 TRINITY_DN4616_c0_g1_i1:119-499(+)